MRDGQLLSVAVKLVRKSRGLSSRQVAAGMNISLRTYQRFEAGSTRLNLDHIHRFGHATGSDPHAVLLAVMIGSPRFALNAADNMLATVLIVAVQNLDRAIGDRVSDLETRGLVSAVAALFDGISDQALASDPADDWLARGRRDLTARRPGPGR
ncbi:helix-turn-helix domain-containing protein [Brevundimonas sp. NPDC092305]|uniref:helix-turn-helix domain-containing protein n=1 Tax=Brevundimonas sp. NPDC092305 TaxID=3363957 RepID=UPI0037F9C212